MSGKWVIFIDLEYLKALEIATKLVLTLENRRLTLSWRGAVTTNLVVSHQSATRVYRIQYNFIYGQQLVLRKHTRRFLSKN